jgi:HAMP domain-containing protein
MNKTHLKAYTNAIIEAALSRSTALEIELSVGFAIILECEGAKRLARETLLTAYHAAGSKCDKPGAIDWKAINRRISAAIALYDFIGKDDVEKWAAGKTKRELVDAFRPHIGALKLKSVNEVLLACDKIQAPRKSPTEQAGQKLNTKHLHLTIPPTTSREELIELATALMTMASSLFVQPEVAEPAEDTVEAE